MAEWKLTQDQKIQYDAIYSNIHELEVTIGSTQYRVRKLLDLRSQMDLEVKKWWDQTLKELNLDKDADYIIGQDGIIKSVDSKNVPFEKSFAKDIDNVRNNIGTNAEELK